MKKMKLTSQGYSKIMGIIIDLAKLKTEVKGLQKKSDNPLAQ